ncbi:hypothetical protein HMPREF9151_02536 [Hoylesella saccharolytica F0055]|uniref:Uncharacterized protein n=1 Tax=Hoylesella saccharolytica F0055 TaxID=1127699 RepID=L1MYQ5_9BACT|nr:hypothetical protein HMPREF9151_02536 [Hoylesella saccharolytica F0055]
MVCKNYRFARQKLCFHRVKAMLLQIQSYAFGKRKLFFDKINIDFRLIETFLRVKSKPCF